MLAGSERPSAGEVMVEGQSVSFRHPADAIRAGVVYVAADRAEALLMQRNVRENNAANECADLPPGADQPGTERKRVYDAVATLQIDARAGAEVRRLSGGNQQKVTIARWVAGGVNTMLASTQRAVSIFGRRLRYMGCCATLPRPAQQSSSTRPN